MEDSRNVMVAIEGSKVQVALNSQRSNPSDGDGGEQTLLLEYVCSRPVRS